MSHEDESYALAHFGVKGMKWGVERRGESTGASEKTPTDHAKLKKAAVIGGTVLAAAAITAGAVYLSKHPELMSSAAKALSSSKNVETGKSFVESAVKEPTGIIHTMDDKGFLFKGGISDPLREYESSGIGNLARNTIRRYGKNSEKVVASLVDPKGRLDRAGRPIVHHIIVPASMSKGVHTIEDVREKIWPKIRHVIDEYHAGSPEEKRIMIRREGR